MGYSYMYIYACFICCQVLSHNIFCKYIADYTSSTFTYIIVYYESHYEQQTFNLLIFHKFK